MDASYNAKPICPDRLTQLFSQWGILSFALGVVWLQQLTTLPSLSQSLVLVLVALFSVYRRYGLLFALILGVLWACCVGQWRLQQVLPESELGVEVPVQGYIVSIPQRLEDRVSFDFVVTDAPETVPDKVRLAWYYPPQNLAAGQSWRFSVKLKPPHGRMNPGGFDYQAWLFANHIGASGYVREKSPYRLLTDHYGPGQWLAAARQAIADQIDQQLPDIEFAGVIKALTLGDQSSISQAQWTVFRITGTTHLAVISGSHITLVAGLMFFVLQRFLLYWRRWHWPVHTIAALGAGTLAIIYALLAGWSVPVQRALIMLGISLWALTAQRHVSAWRVLLLALLGVLLFDPLAVISIGFWLSFLAVALLLYTGSARLGRINFWRELGLAQWTTALGLAPILLLYFQQLSVVSPLANALAVPVIGLLIVPMALVAVLVGSLFAELGAQILTGVDFILHGLWWLLDQMAQWNWAQLYWPSPGPLALIFAALGVLLALAPKGFPGRYLAVFLCLPVLFSQQPKPEAGEAWLTLLDVGQGLACVVQTQNHVLLFDAGARFSEQSDMGESVVLPFLRNRNIRHLDLLMISHGDNDHSGGADSIQAAMPVERLLSSVEPWAVQANGQFCRAGDEWNWDGVRFRVLSPTEPLFDKENNNSCVLQVVTQAQQWLLTGDIEREAELDLVHRYDQQLQSLILLAPHHGSKTSSSEQFLQAVQPRLILIPAGYANRFHFPHPSIINRYQNYQIDWLSSAHDGAIFVQSQADQFHIQTARQQMRRYWMAED